VQRPGDDDYYSLLGLQAGASGAELRKAWRRLALRWHPDRAGPSATETFQRIAAAYVVLADPIARAAYDRRRGVARPRATAPASPTIRRRAPGVLLHRLSGPLNALLAGGVARRAETGVIEIFLRPDEIESGGMATISLRVAIHCPDCAAAPADSCARCGTRRTVEELFSAWLAIPPEVADGAMLEPSVPLRGMVRPITFRVLHR
jgi:hypothetical protein